MKTRHIFSILLLALFGASFQYPNTAKAQALYSQPQILSVNTDWRVFNSNSGDQVIYSTVIPGGTIQPNAILEIKIQGELHNQSAYSRYGNFILQYGFESATVFVHLWPASVPFVDQMWTIRMQPLNRYATYTFVSVENTRQDNTLNMTGFAAGPNYINEIMFPNMDNTVNQPFTLTWQTNVTYPDMYTYAVYNSMMTLYQNP